jgi:GTP-binding protein
VALIANKLEGDSWAYDGSPVMGHLREVTSLGFGEAIPISALQGDGLADIAILIEQLKGEKQTVEEDTSDESGTHPKSPISTDDKPLQIAIIGRQNVGKSTLLNRLVDENRVLSGPMPGLTRDAISVEWTWEGQNVQLVDTAGIRKLTKRMEDSIEDMSVADALRAMKVAEVAVLVLDAEAMYIQKLELALCNAVIQEGRALVIAANKMDLLELADEDSPKKFADAVREQVESRLPSLRRVPIVPMSCLSGEGVSELLPTVLDARNRWARTFSTAILNRWLREVITGVSPPIVEGVRAKLKYIIQTKGRPPTFIIFSNVGDLPDTYLRYLTKEFQDSFELYGMPVRLLVQKSSKSNPYTSTFKKKRIGFGLGGRDARMQRRVKDFQTKKHDKKNRS